MEPTSVKRRSIHPGSHPPAYYSTLYGSGSSSDLESSYSSKPAKRRSTRRVAITSALVAAAVTTAVLLGISLTTPPSSPLHRSSTLSSPAVALSGDGALLSDAELAFGIAQCTARHPPDAFEFAPAGERINQRDASNGQAVLIRRATVWNGHGDVLPNTDVLLVNGLIHAVGPDLKLPPGHPAEGKVKEIDARGRIVTPGIVDMHSHAGVDSFPSLQGTDDGNELGDPNLPMMRTIDAFHPHDKALPLILSGGVTTILVLPGSANLQGGEAFAFKTPQKPTNSAEDMLVFSNLSRTDTDGLYLNGGPMWRWAKQACGENPKRTYGEELGRQPFTRMGNAFKLRENYAKAQALRQRQDEWCRVSESLGLYKPGPDAEKKTKEKKHEDKGPKLKGVIHPKGRYPTDLALEQVVALMRGQVKLNWHCYEVNDLETQMRIAREFNVSISAFHHAIDIAKVTSALKRWSSEGRTPIGAAIFSDLGWYKKEAYQASVFSPQILEREGVPFAFKSDHPVTHSQFLVHDSARSIQYGLSEQSVLKALTLTPAKLLGLDYRLGSIDVGKDADVVIWPANPFIVGSMPDVVIVDGAVAFEKSVMDATSLAPQPQTPVPPQVPITVDPKKDEFLFKNIGKIVTGNRTVDGPVEIRVSAGRITCVGKCSTTPPEGNAMDSAVAQEFDLQGATVTPSLVLAGTVLGLLEIAEEPSTQAGVAKTGGSAFPLVYARDGLLAGGLPEQAAANQGIGLALSVTQVKGSPSLSVSTLFATNHTLPHVVHDVGAVHTLVGDAGKGEGGLSGSYPGQIAALRKWLTDALPKSEDASEDVGVTSAVRTGAVPLVVHAQSANVISALLNLKWSVDRANVQRWVISGAAESHLNVDELAAFNGTVGVLLSPARCIPKEWVTRRCLSPPNAYRGAIHAAELFKRFNVPFALSTDPSELASARNLRFEAGWVRRFAGLSEQEMVASVTSSVVRLVLPKVFANEYTGTVEKQLQVGGVARFNAWNGDFGELKTQLLFGVDGGSATVINYPVHI